jgi:hypothetical protein
VGAIAVARSDPNVIYTGMGERDIRGNASHGDGVYKSTDAGSHVDACWTDGHATDRRSDPVSSFKIDGYFEHRTCPEQRLLVTDSLPSTIVSGDHLDFLRLSYDLLTENRSEFSLAIKPLGPLPEEPQGFVRVA